MTTNHDRLALAVNMFQQKNFSHAEALFRVLLSENPNNYDAAHYFGLLKATTGRFKEALPLIRTSLRQKSTFVAYSENYVTILCQVGEYQEAVVACTETIAATGMTERLQYALGCGLSKQGKYADAIIAFDVLLARYPNNAFAYNDKGFAQSEAGLHEEALASLSKASQLSPGFWDAWLNRGNVLGALGRFNEAVDCYKKAIQLDLGIALAHLGLGNVYRNLKRHDEASAAYDRALSIKPDLENAWLGRGNIFFDIKRYEEALAAYDRALSIKSDLESAWLGRGNVFFELRRYEEALIAYDEALSIKPNLESVWLGRGNVFCDLKRYDEALAAYDKALSINPNSEDAWLGLGRAKLDQGKIQESLFAFDKACALRPGFGLALSNKIFALDFTDAGFAEQQEARRRWCSETGSKISQLPPALNRNDRDPNRRLIVGYVSADFRDHSASRAFSPVLRHCDKSRFELVCYSNSTLRDGLTEQFVKIADRWRDVLSLSDDALAAQIREDKVDVLVDLSGHSAGNRLEVFARKPAPIQVTAWGHATGTGLPTMDYFFADPVSVPVGVRSLFAEIVFDLPCILTIEPPPYGLAAAEPPSLANGYVTFGVFNRTSKVTDQTILLWSQILLEVPASVIVFKHGGFDDLTIRSRIINLFADKGVDPRRILFRGGSPRPEHLAAFRDVDISLDPFPNNGGVSTWESLQMGVPVVAKLGNGTASRAAASIINSIGLGEWIASDDEHYVAIATEFARHPGRLRSLRSSLPERIIQSVSGNAVLYTKAVETAYETMLRNRTKTNSH
ncbi:MAG TPA: tetratricopeptide repeat protein [Xanthobacteraceae bacterium]|jgi:predicted O-linked N-acetylglucosamine transferase (SPINDLY family)|nr:tetratricopeptide repeat protein [Xanthobacteraceae bacterium]